MRIGIVGVVIALFGTLVQPARAVEEVTRPLREFGRGRIQYAAYTSGGAQIWSSNWGKVDVWDAIDGTPSTDLPVVPRGRYNGISLDGHIALQPSGTGTNVLDLDTSTVLRTLPVSGDNIATISPDGSLALFRDDGVWDLRTGQFLHKPEGNVNATFTADSSKYLMGSQLLAARTGTVIRSFIAPEGYPDITAITADGRKVLGVDSSAGAWVWDAETGEIVGTLAHTGYSDICALSPDGGTALIATYVPSDYDAGKHIEVWDVSLGTRLATFSDTSYELTALGFSPDGSHFFVADDAWIRIRDTSTLETTGVVDAFTGRVSSLNFSPDGTRIVSAHSDRTARVWDANTGEQVLRLIGHNGPVARAEYSPEGSRILSASTDSTVRLWDAKTGQQLRVYPHPASVIDVALSPDGRNLVSVGYSEDDPTLRIWDVDRTTPLASLPSLGGRDVEYLPDGSAFMVASEYPSVSLRNALTGEILRTYRASLRIAIDPTGRYYVDGNLNVTEIATGTVLRRGEWGFATWSIDLSPDGSHAIRGSYLEAELHDLGTGELRKVFRGFNEVVRFSPDDGNIVLTAGYDGPIRLWDSGLHLPMPGNAWICQ